MCDLSGCEVGRTPLSIPSEITTGWISEGGGGAGVESHGKGVRGGGSEGGWTFHTPQFAVLSVI